MVSDPDGSNRQADRDRGPATARPAWSPDGSSPGVPFRSAPARSTSTRWPPTGPTFDAVATEPSSDYGATWSPDGSRIAFSSDRDGSVRTSTRSATDGTDVVRLTRGERRRASIPPGRPTGHGSRSTRPAPTAASPDRHDGRRWTDVRRLTDARRQQFRRRPGRRTARRSRSPTRPRRRPRGLRHERRRHEPAGPHPQSGCRRTAGSGCRGRPTGRAILYPSQGEVPDVAASPSCRRRSAPRASSSRQRSLPGSPCSPCAGGPVPFGGLTAARVRSDRR